MATVTYRMRTNGQLVVEEWSDGFDYAEGAETEDFPVPVPTAKPFLVNFGGAA